MAWRLAKSLETLRSEINKAFPDRHKSSDGTIGDAKHASRGSDHNPWVKDGKTGVVTAIDFTHDPEHSFDSEVLAETLRASKDSRIKYIISNRKICSSTKNGKSPPWAWRKYTGSNHHDKHMHLSVKSDKASYDSTKPWNLIIKSAKHIPSHGDEGAEIEAVQRRLRDFGYKEVGEIDGKWGSRTSGAVAAFKNDRHMAGSPSIDAALAAELDKAEAEGFTRPIAPSRAQATPAELAPKLPEVQAAVTAERLGFWGSIAAGASTVITGVTKFVGDAVEWLNPLKEFVGDVPWPVWIGGALVVSGALYYISRKSGDAKNLATLAYQEGARV